MRRPLVKICGLTRAADAVLAADLGADFLGLNFYPPSPRALEPERAAAIAAEVRGRVRLVGVFVNEPRERVEEVAQQVGLDLVQLHGDEGPAEVAAFGARAIKAFRVGEAFDPAEMAEYPEAGGFLFDHRHPTLYGGGGVGWPYERIAGVAAGRLVLVAGGIGPHNARRALELSGAGGVDVCTGVESRPGVKDPAALERLFDEIRHAPLGG